MENNHLLLHCPLLMLIARILLFSFMTMAGAAVEALRNVTIDDYYGDEITLIVPTYLPPKQWSTLGDAKPNASLTYKKTWHDTTYHPGRAAHNVSFEFTGPWNIYPILSTSEGHDFNDRCRLVCILHYRKHSSTVLTNIRRLRKLHVYP